MNPQSKSDRKRPSNGGRARSPRDPAKPSGPRARPRERERERERERDEAALSLSDLDQDTIISRKGESGVVENTRTLSRRAFSSKKTTRSPLSLASARRGVQRTLYGPPKGGALAGDAERGEIWLSSNSVAVGYWGKPELSEETFAARRARTAAFFSSSLSPFLSLLSKFFFL